MAFWPLKPIPTVPTQPIKPSNFFEQLLLEVGGEAIENQEGHQQTDTFRQKLPGQQDGSAVRKIVGFCGC